MNKYVKNKLVDLPRPLRIWWGRCFMYMLGKIGTHEFQDDVALYNELRKWVESGGKPTTPFIK